MSLKCFPTTPAATRGYNTFYNLQQPINRQCCCLLESSRERERQRKRERKRAPQRIHRDVLSFLVLRLLRNCYLTELRATFRSNLPVSLRRPFPRIPGQLLQQCWPVWHSQLVGRFVPRQNHSRAKEGLGTTILALDGW